MGKNNQNNSIGILVSKIQERNKVVIKNIIYLIIIKILKFLIQSSIEIFQ